MNKNRQTKEHIQESIRRIRAIQVEEQKHPLRCKLDSDVEAFLKRGGEIQSIPRGVSGERNKKYGRWTGISL